MSAIRRSIRRFAIPLSAVVLGTLWGLLASFGHPTAVTVGLGAYFGVFVGAVAADLRRRKTTPAAAVRDDLLAAAKHFADTWRELVTGMPDDFRCTYTCSEANAVAGLYQALGDKDTAAQIIAAHAAYDEEGDEHHPTAPVTEEASQ